MGLNVRCHDILHRRSSRPWRRGSDTPAYECTMRCRVAQFPGQKRRAFQASNCRVGFVESGSTFHRKLPMTPACESLPSPHRPAPPFYEGASAEFALRMKENSAAEFRLNFSPQTADDSRTGVFPFATSPGPPLFMRGYRQIPARR
jgi:hypothetical protein